mmetsp:Transcript_14653/g.41191  ORF Transcript_14653/g.41191 Transcript_14653/m.41191 type:complete len:410 (+) Transcript_14653:151-1380(+)|eukprot:CAMPEP_0117659990 /NCGR_PEP_ID=MMETSP0804-20121206/6726_1 /TAXON_ID=1074897 /ORGANISM="Tetraselmis astigmatica, Strain CCMP880" /LENGTH=409 /DNA_ID=CAMNT_0005466683 /DNA_START=81 /DNA_END=1310 /DNA_ORIENTATION=-
MASSSATPAVTELPAEEKARLDAEAQATYEDGIQLIKENKIDEAVELFYGLLEIRTGMYGELALECAPVYFKYGSCLFYKAQDEVDFLGEQMQSAADQRDGAARTSDEQPPSTTPTNDSKGKGKAPAEEESQEAVKCEEAPGGDEDEEEGDEDGEDDANSEKTDMELAWENLETARHIYAKNIDSLTEDQKLTFAEVHERLGDLSMEKEDFETCIADFKEALALFQQLLPTNDRRMASLHFKMALGFQFMDEPEEGLKHCQQALQMVESKVSELKSLVPDGVVDPAAAQAADIHGVLDDLRDKEVELKEVIAQNATTKEVIKNAFAQFTGGMGAAPAANVVDLGVVGSSTGRNRATPVPVSAAPAADSAAAPAASTEATEKSKKKRSLEDLMGGEGGTTTVGFGGDPES